jgi:hypothetical protein
LSYNISLLANRVLEICPLQGSPLPCRVRFRLLPGQQGTVVLQLLGQSAQGAAWQPGMRQPLAAWCQRYLGATLSPEGPGEGKG